VDFYRSTRCRVDATIHWSPDSTPVFANTKVIRRADRFLRRGLVACQAEWRLIAATHNLLKLWRAGLATASKPSPQPLAA
jgi:hypothetical protein